MKTLFSRILFAQVVAVVLALLVVTVITRASLTRGFERFLERQESTVLESVAPVLIDTYQRLDGWQFLRDKPNNWQRIWRSARNPRGDLDDGDPRPRRGRMRDEPGPPVAEAPEAELRWMRQPDRGMLRERLFLLDENRVRIAGAEIADPDTAALQELRLDGQVIGWIGFTPMGSFVPPEAQHFLDGQVRITIISLAVALLVASALAYLLARNVSRPVRELGRTIRRLSGGEYEARAPAAVHDEMGRLAAHVNQLAESLEKNRTARQRWMADIAHELRTPISVLKGEIEALADGVRQADQRMAASLAEEINHLASLVDDLQALALADAGALDLRMEQVDFSALLSQSAEVFRNRFDSRDVSLSVESGSGVILTGDAHRLRQLVHNLLENSCRYVEQGGRVSLILESGAEVCLTLQDSGPGVSDEQLGRLFDRFYRVEGSRARLTGGSGLGLSICRNIVEAHGGEIRAEHSPHGGLLIRVELPSRSGS